MPSLRVRKRIVKEARSWIGTPFHWQQSCKGAGCDCIGLIAGIARNLGLPEAQRIPPEMSNYRTVVPSVLKAGLAAVFDPVAEGRIADILLLKVAGKAQHIGILVAPDRMIHTYGTGPRQVIEVPYGHTWRAATDSIWTWRG